jgi:glycine/D-amino acid oxidase-like deaminating enzyme
VVICGAGIAGVSAAYWLSQDPRYTVTLIDERDPLSLTSDKSSEAYRDWWPDPAMAALMSRSIDLLDALSGETGNAFHMNRRGYLYATLDEDNLSGFEAAARKTAQAAGTELRVHRTAAGSSYVRSRERGARLTGADLLLDPALIRSVFPYLSTKTCAVLHARRAGWLSAQQLGAILLEKARSNGAHFVRGRVDSVEIIGGRVRSSMMAGGQAMGCEVFINASGPFLVETGRMVEVDLPVRNEVHLKSALRDSAGAVPRDAPLTILADRQRLDWSDEERSMLADDPELEYLLGELPSGAHLRPEGPADSPILLLLWDYRKLESEPVHPVPADPIYQEIALRGLSSLVPGLKGYIERPQRPSVDGGYYTRTIENRPLIGPCGPAGSYVIGALSGYGIMAAMAAGELLRACIDGGKLPGYAEDMALARYEEEGYLEKVLQEEDGQL